MRTKWPSPQDFNEAIQNPKTCFKDESLKRGEVELNALGIPRVESGNFANVYKLKCADGDFAVRCFTHHVADSAARYALLSDFILHDDLIYTVTFDFQQQGIRIGKDWYPIVKMEWVHGDHFISWIDQHIEDPHRITQLADNFLTLTSDLLHAGIAHGDLQHGNMIIVGDDFRLVDYDGMFVPAMTGMRSNELGHANYQHPQRTQDHFGTYLDNFSAWLIFASLEIVARDPSLWQQFGKPNGETILFTASDLRSPPDSPLFQRLLQHSESDIRLAANSILDLLSLPPEQVPPPAVAHRNMHFSPVKAPSWMDKLVRRARKFVQRMSPPPPKPAPPPAPVQTPAEPAQQRALPLWLEDWVKQAPPPPPARNVSGLPPMPPPIPHPKDHRGEPIHDYDIRRMLQTAKRYAEAGRYHKAKRLLGKAQEAARTGKFPALITEALRAEAYLMAHEAESHIVFHRYHEATTLYQKAAGAMNLVSNLSSGRPDRDDDLVHARYLVGVGNLYKEHGRERDAAEAYSSAIALLGRHPNTKADIARIVKLFPAGHNPK